MDIIDQTKAVLIVLALSCNASADQFDTYALQNNARVQMAVLTGEALKLYQKLDNPDDPGVIKFGQPRWVKNLGIAPFELITKQDHHSGYMAFLLDKTNRVKSLMWTHGEPEKSWTTWDLELSQAADVSSTALALSQGLVESNPLAQGAALPIVMVGKMASSYYVKRHSLQACQGSTMVSGLGMGIGTMNLITLGVGSFAPWALVPAGLVAYAASPDQNEAFWDCIRVFTERSAKVEVAQTKSLFLEPY